MTEGRTGGSCFEKVPLSSPLSFSHKTICPNDVAGCRMNCGQQREGMKERKWLLRSASSGIVSSWFLRSSFGVFQWRVLLVDQLSAAACSRIPLSLSLSIRGSPLLRGLPYMTSNFFKFPSPAVRKIYINILLVHKLGGFWTERTVCSLLSQPILSA